MVTLRIIPERLLDARPSGERRYAQNLGAMLIARAPAGCDVEAILPKVSDDEAEHVSALLPGLTDITQGPRRREALGTAWRRGMHTGRLGGGFIHAMSLYAPMRDISLSYGIDQTVVTVHDTSVIRRPELHTRDEVRFTTAMLKRAQRFASAIAVPSHAVADELTELYDLADRVRVVGGAADHHIALPDTEDEGDRLAARMNLPEDYVLTLAGPEPRKGLEPLLRGFAGGGGGGSSLDVPLVVLGPTAASDDPAAPTTDALIAASGIDRSRVIATGEVSDTMLAVALQRASALVVPSLESGFGLPIVEAFQIGTPVIVSDTPSHLEVAADAGYVVERGDLATYPDRLAAAVAEVVHDTELTRKLRVTGRDRSHIYHWAASAEAVWALHADL